MIAEFFGWWGEQLWSLLPASISAALKPKERRILLALDSSGDPSSGLTVISADDDAMTPLGSFPLTPAGVAAAGAHPAFSAAGGQVFLSLPDASFREKPLSLPLLSKRDLSAAVRGEIDRETPFSPDEVYWAARPISTDAERGRMVAMLDLVLKRSVAASLEQLAPLGIGVAGLADQRGRPRIRFEAGPSENLIQRNLRLLAAPLPAMTCVLGLLCIGAPFVIQSLQLTAVDGRIAALTPAADEARRLRRDAGIADGPDSGRFRGEGNPLAVLAAVTAALPDDTHLHEFHLAGAQLDLSGLSANASSLIEKLASTSGLANPAFSAPVQHPSGSPLESFSIRLSLARVR